MGHTLHTVDIALPESLNAVWKHVKIHRDLGVEEAKEIVKDLTKIYDKLKILTTREVCEQALLIALTHNVTAYDALYMAAAQRAKATLYTADQELHNEAEKLVDSQLLKPE
jgi:predicted nucleic acid-binding protein